ncbi:hypothetical protein Ahy_A07g032645 [Arachis hypogaea]|uniref:Uncharacterized protein n=1 Tax=Arachis hypogaea TaxID=3818 RepID=A0A445C7H9_ARAHY|nr:hypothetical protein Ahy_A07g032645 [Arachis hypogaea]
MQKFWLRIHQTYHLLNGLLLWTIIWTLKQRNNAYQTSDGEIIGKACMSKRKKRHLPQDQQRAATEGIHSKVLAHPNNTIKKVCGLENGKRVRGFSNVTCPNDFGKSKRIFGVANCRVYCDLEKQLQKVKNQVATLYKFLQQKYDNEVPTFSDHVSHTQSD